MTFGHWTAAQLAGQVAVITGGSAGIGLAAAEALGQLGIRPVLVGRRRAALATAKEHLALAGIEADTIAADVTRVDDLARMAATTLDHHGRIDILIAAAGILRPASGAIRHLADMPLDEWDQVLRTNLTGTFLANRAVLPTMLERGCGQIINVSSTSGRRGYAYDSAYCASKFGVIGLTESLAAEVGPLGIRVQVLLPGAIETPMWAQNGPIPRPAQVLPVARVGELIARLVALPPDTELAETVIEPQRSVERPVWLGGPSPG
jgi:NAD(P)-dependent dehydrogenase (short-subunit alcohol dehydrogenase family)